MCRMKSDDYECDLRTPTGTRGKSLSPPYAATGSTPSDTLLWNRGGAPASSGHTHEGQAMADTKQKISISRADDAIFDDIGRRVQLESRDLGVRDATGGLFNAQVVRTGTGAGERKVEGGRLIRIAG